MRSGAGKILGALAPLFVMLAATAPAAAPDGPGARVSVDRDHGAGAVSAATMTVLTVSGLRGVANRINVFIGPTGRLTLIAPEALTDPDGEGGTNCTLDNARPGEATATQISCAPGYAQAIVGDLGGGDDVFSATPDLPVLIGAVLDGERRPLSGGDGSDRIVSGAMGDLLEGGAEADVLIGNGGEDLLRGGGAGDKLLGGGARDALFGGGGRDRLSGGTRRDLCNGGSARDSAKSCEILQAIP